MSQNSPVLSGTGEPDYSKLKDVLDRAFERANSSKGRERHAAGRDFDKQPIIWINEWVGGGFCLGQVLKKLDEQRRMPTEEAVKELLDAIVYLSAEIIWKEQHKDQ